jgi:GAF domain-containing protein
MGAWSIDIQAYNAEREDLLYMAYWCAEGATDRDLGFVGHVVRLADWPTWRRVVDVPEMLERHIDDPDLPSAERLEMESWGYQTTLDCPLIFAGEVVGVLGLRETRFVRRFTEVERDLLSQFCDLAAIAIRNAQIYRRQQEEQLRLSSLAKMGDALTSTLDLTGVCLAIARAGAAAFAAPRAIIYEADAPADTITARAFYEAEPFPGYDDTGAPEELSGLPHERAILAGRSPVAWRVSDAGLDEDIRAEMTRWHEATTLNVPLVFRDRPLGILTIVWTDEERDFSADELEFAVGVGEHAAVALEQARLQRRGGATPGEELD